MLRLVILLLCTNIGVAAPPEISLTIHRMVDEEQNVNETLHVHATHDLIILEASDVMDQNVTDANNATEHNTKASKFGSVPLTRLTRGTNITRDDKGNVVVQLPTKGNATTDVVVGQGAHVVNQIVSGELAVESKGGW